MNSSKQTGYQQPRYEGDGNRRQDQGYMSPEEEYRAIFERAYEEGRRRGYDAGYSRGHHAGYHKGYEDCIKDQQHNEYCALTRHEQNMKWHGRKSRSWSWL